MKNPQPYVKLNTEKIIRQKIFFHFCSEGAFFRVRTNLRQRLITCNQSTKGLM